MDAERLDFPEGAFSRVLCGFGLMFLTHLDLALSECRRVLEPGVGSGFPPGRARRLTIFALSWTSSAWAGRATKLGHRSE
jgi:ubiquinone/menaquinone biosynthesis C-methylase UbiE